MGWEGLVGRWVVGCDGGVLVGGQKKAGGGPLAPSPFGCQAGSGRGPPLCLPSLESPAEQVTSKHLGARHEPETEKKEKSWSVVIGKIMHSKRDLVGERDRAQGTGSVNFRTALSAPRRAHLCSGAPETIGLRGTEAE